MSHSLDTPVHWTRIHCRGESKRDKSRSRWASGVPWMWIFGEVLPGISMEYPASRFCTIVIAVDVKAWPIGFCFFQTIIHRKLTRNSIACWKLCSERGFLKINSQLSTNIPVPLLKYLPTIRAFIRYVWNIYHRGIVHSINSGDSTLFKDGSDFVGFPSLKIVTSQGIFPHFFLARAAGKGSLWPQFWRHPWSPMCTKFYYFKR